MAESESGKEIVNQVAMQAAMTVMMAFKDTETGSQPATTPNQQENQRYRNDRLVLEKTRFNWNMPDGYVKLLHFQLEVMNILESRAKEINDEARIPVIMSWLGWEGLLFMETFTQEEKEKCKTIKGLFSVLSNRFKVSFQYQKLHRERNNSAQEWMDRL